MHFKPLAGIRILDFSWNVAGPTATRFLAQLGADVIKVEWPNRPDPGRNFAFSPVQEGVIDSSGFFADLNVGKRSFTVDTKSAAGRELVDGLMRRSDVVIEAFSPGVMSDWGWSFERMQELNPDLIYLSLSGFGHSGPYGDYVAYGPTAQAASGVTYSSGEPGKPPAGWGFSYLDLLAGYQAAWATVAALRKKLRGGGGQRIDLSQIETGASALGVVLLDQIVNQTPLEPTDFPPGCRSAWPGAEIDGFRYERGAPYNLYPTADQGDDAYCAITVLNETQWAAFKGVMGNPAWAERSEFGELEGRIRHQDELDALVGAWTVSRGKYELMAALQAAGVPAGAMQTGRERLEMDPSLRARGAVQVRTHPVVGKHRFTSIPFRVDDAPAAPEDRWPLLGRQTYAVLGDLLGMSTDEIGRVEASGALWPLDNKPVGVPTDPLDSQVDRVVPPPPTAGESRAAEQLPLEGIRVLEVDDDGVAQYAGKLLSDLGAEVIKIEPVDGVKPRHVGPFKEGVEHPEGSLSFWYYNAGKKSVVLDLEAFDGMEQFTRLASGADVVLDGLVPARSDELGLPDALARINEPPLHAAVSRFGRTGPWRDYLGSDLVSLALGGVAGQTGYDAIGQDPAQPIAPTGGQSVHYAGLIAATSIIAALLVPRGERANQLDVAVHDTIAMSTEIPMSLWEFGGTEVKRHTGRHSAAAPHTPLWQHQCADGAYVCALPLYLNDRRFASIIDWFDSSGASHDLHNPRYATHALREENLHDLADEFAAFCAANNSDDIFRQAQSRAIPWAKVVSPAELIDDPHLRARDFFARVGTPGGGVTPFPKQAWIEMPTKLEDGVKIPELGSSNPEIFNTDEESHMAGTTRKTEDATK